MPVRTIDRDEAAARRQHGKKGVFGASTYANFARDEGETPQQGPPAFSSQGECSSLEGLKRALLSPGVWSAAARSRGNSADPEPVGSEPMYLTSKRGARPELHQSSYLAPGPMCSSAQAPFSQTPKEGSGEPGLLGGSQPGAKGKGKAPCYQSQDGADSQSTLTPRANTSTPGPQQALIGHRATSRNYSTSALSRELYTLNFQNQSLSLPYLLNSMTSLPTASSSRSVPGSGSSSLPDTSTETTSGRELAIYQNAVLVAGAQKEHEEKMGGRYGQDFGISSTNPDGHYVCGQVLQDMKVRNVELKAEVQAIKSKEEELKHENNAIKDHCSAMETTLLSVGSQQTISLGDFTKMMGEIAHLRAIAEHTGPMVETVYGYQQEIAVLRARLLANGLDPSIIAGPVSTPQEPTTALMATIQEAPVSGSVASVSNSVKPEEDNGRFPSNKFFVGEFGILFRSIANLGRCNYQFTRQMPVTTVQIPPHIREKLKIIVQGNEPLLNWLLDDTNKTKFLLVSGLFARLIYEEVMVETFVDQLILNMGEAPSEKARILSGWVQNNPHITNKVWPVLTDMSEALAGQLHDKYLSLLSRPTDTRHLEESLRSLIGCIEHAGRLALGMAHLGWGNWRFVFQGTGFPFQCAKMTICDLGTEGLLNFGHDTRILEEKEAKIKFSVFPMVYRRDSTGAWKVLVKATALV